MRADLLGSKDVLLITGYTSLDWIINLLAAFRGKGDAAGRGADRIRILIGVEPQAIFVPARTGAVQTYRAGT